MAFKERVKKFGSRVKEFWNEHWGEVVLVTGGIALTGAACYVLHKTGTSEYHDRLNELKEKPEEAKRETLEDKTAWNKDWDEMAVQFELLTHQPLGSFANGYTEEEGYVDPLNGNCFIIAGNDSYYNDDSNSYDFYVLDNEGYFHRMPDELRT